MKTARLHRCPITGIVATAMDHAKRLGLRDEDSLRRRFREIGEGNPRAWCKAAPSSLRGTIPDPLGVRRTISEHAKAHGILAGTLCWRSHRYGWADLRTWAGSKLDLPEPEPHRPSQRDMFGGFI